MATDLSRPSAGVALAAGALVVAVGAGLIAPGGIELAGLPHPDIWSNAWVSGGVIVIALGVLLSLLLLGMCFFGRSVPDVTGGSDASRATVGDAGRGQETWNDRARLGVLEMDSESRSPRDAPFTHQWQHTADGFKATPLMNMTSYAMPGYAGSRDASPFIRIGVCMACDPSDSETADSSQMRAGLIGFLGRDPVANLIRTMTDVGEAPPTWTPQAGRGVLRIDAVLGTGEEPVASAMLHLPFTDLRQTGRSHDMACLWLQVVLRGEDGRGPPRPASLAGWHRRFGLALSIAPAFVNLLSRDLNLSSSDQPAARVGVMLQAKKSLADLADAGELPILPGATPSNQFLGYAIAHPDGKPTDDAARDFLRQLCDYDLQVDVAGSALQSIGALPKSGFRVSVPWGNGRRAGTVVTEPSDTDPRVIVAVPVEGHNEPLSLAFGAEVVEVVPQPTVKPSLGSPSPAEQPSPPHSQLREALDAAAGPDDLAEALDAADGFRSIQQHSAVTRNLHSYCVKCGFPFIRPQIKPACQEPKACDKRLGTPLDHRLRAGKNSPFKVHLDWAASRR